MKKHTVHKEVSQVKQIRFNTNPFSLSFKALGEGFKINQNPVIALIAGGFILSILQQTPNMFSDLFNLLYEDGSTSESTEAVIAIFVLLFLGVGSLIGIAVGGLWNGFCAYIGVLNARGERTTVGLAFKAAWSKFFSVLAIQFITGLISFAWFLPSMFVAAGALIFHSQDVFIISYSGFVVAGILFIGGILMSIRAQLSRTLAPYALFDGAHGSMEAMRQSMMLTKGRLMEIFGLGFACAIVLIVNSALTPLGFGAHYLQLKTYKQANAPIPKIHILSWLPVFAIVLGILLSGLVALLIIALTRSDIN